MLEIDRPFEGLDEVWTWRIPHPADPDEPKKHARVTRIGTIEGASLVGRLEIVSRPSRTVFGVVTELQGLGPWRKAKLGSVSMVRSGESQWVREGRVRSGDGDGSWKPGGHFQVGDHVEVNQIATAGAPYPPSVRELGESALAAGRSLLRRVRDRGDQPDEVPSTPEAEPDPDAEPAVLTAFDGWLTATRVDVAGEPAWRLAIDRRPDAPDSVGLGVVLAAIGLLHRNG